jgi:hypothetical protein
VTIDTFDLWDASLPEFGPGAGIADTTEIHFRPDLATADADAGRQAAHAAAREAAKKV